VHQALMVGHLTPTDPAFTQRLAATQHALAQEGDPVTATHQAYAAIYGLLNAQAHLWAFVDNFRIFGVMLLCCLPLIFLFKRVKHAPVRQAAVE
jgi:DHA2 family multidrug resistance protein